MKPAYTAAGEINCVTYMHFDGDVNSTKSSKINPNLSVGKAITSADWIGATGSTGSTSSGNQMHLQISNIDGMGTNHANTNNPIRYFPNIKFHIDSASGLPSKEDWKEYNCTVSTTGNNCNETRGY
jgi:hypothetical protein